MPFYKGLPRGRTYIEERRALLTPLAERPKNNVQIVDILLQEGTCVGPVLPCCHGCKEVGANVCPVALSINRKIISKVMNEEDKPGPNEKNVLHGYLKPVIEKQQKAERAETLLARQLLSHVTVDPLDNRTLPEIAAFLGLTTGYMDRSVVPSPIMEVTQNQK